MKIKKVNLDCYRNVSHLELCPCETINVLYGDNAQGKTNLIEAIWLFTGNKSFRGAKKDELIQFDCDQAKVSVVFEDGKREQQATLTYGNMKKIILNKVELKTTSELSGNFYAVVFSPDHLSLIKEGTKNRRKFIDNAISQIKPQYKNYLKQFEKLLDQRNALLKSQYSYPNLQRDIDVWDIQMAKIGTIISIYRNDYVKKLYKSAQGIYEGISRKKEIFSMSYISTIYENMSEITLYDDKQVTSYYQKLKDNYSNDVKQGMTLCGIHRDDLDILIDEYSVKMYGSQGQQRSCVIALKLSEAILLKKITGENPIMLLDDVMSELDERRQDYILNHVKNMQVFITCCDISNTARLKNGRVFQIEKGAIKNSYDIDVKKG